MSVTVMDKDVGQLTDDYVGTFNTTVSPGAKEFNLEGSSFRRNRGVFWLEVCLVFPAAQQRLTVRSAADPIITRNR